MSSQLELKKKIMKMKAQGLGSINGVNSNKLINDEQNKMKQDQSISEQISQFGNSRQKQSVNANNEDQSNEKKQRQKIIQKGQEGFESNNTNLLEHQQLKQAQNKCNQQKNQEKNVQFIQQKTIENTTTNKQILNDQNKEISIQNHQLRKQDNKNQISKLDLSAVPSISIEQPILNKQQQKMQKIILKQLLSIKKATKNLHEALKGIQYLQKKCQGNINMKNRIQKTLKQIHSLNLL